MPPIRSLKLPFMSNFRTKPSPPASLVVQGVLAAAGRRRIPRNPDVVVLVDIDAVLAVGPDAARFQLAFAADETGIGRTAPGAQQFAIGIEFQNGRSGLAAIRDGAVGAHLAQPVDRLAVLIFRAGQRPFQAGLLVGQGARPVIDPDMVVPVHIQPADLAESPVLGSGCGHDGSTTKLGVLPVFGGIVDTRLLEQPFEGAVLLKDVAVGIGAPAGRRSATWPAARPSIFGGSSCAFSSGHNKRCAGSRREPAAGVLSPDRSLTVAAPFVACARGGAGTVGDRRCASTGLQRNLQSVYICVIDSRGEGHAHSGNTCNVALSRRAVFRGLAGFLAGSPLLAGQLDPFRDHSRIPRLGEMRDVFDFEPVAFAMLPRQSYDYLSYGVDGEFTLRRNREAFDWVDLRSAPAGEASR